MPQVVGAAVVAGVGAAVTAGATAVSIAVAVGSSLVLGGAQMLLSSGGKKGKSLSSSRLDAVTNVRQPITTHALVYGQRRVAGPMTFVASTSENQYLHIIVILAPHKLEEIGEVWLGDEPIPADCMDSIGNVISGKYEGYARIRKIMGDPAQAADPYLVAEVNGWTAAHRNRGRAYLYVRLKFSQEVFKGNIPNISAVVKGRKVYDPRDGNYKFTSNAALLARDYLADKPYGFEAEGQIDEAAAIAAANICDEIVDVQHVATAVESVSAAEDCLELDCDILPVMLGDRVEVSSSGSLPTGLSAATAYYAVPYQFKRMSGNWSGNKPRLRFATSMANAEAGIYIDLTTAGSGTMTVTKTGEPRFHAAAILDSANKPRENMLELLTGFGGRLVYAGGSWRLLAAAYQPPSFTLTERDIIGPVKVLTKVSRSERFNVIKGVYTTQLNDWNGADYAPVRDAAAVTRDGQEIARDYDLPVTPRPFTAQRIGKVELKKAVQEQTVSVPCSLRALQCQAGENIRITHPLLGWEDKLFEVEDFKFAVEGDDEPVLNVQLALRETAAEIYDWDSSEESTVDPAPNTNLPNAFIVSAVSGLRFDSVPVGTRDGDEVYNILVSWNSHPDAFVLSGGRYEVQYKAAADTDYQPSLWVDGELTSSVIAVGSSGVTYDIRVRAVNNVGSRSAWQPLTGVVTGGSGGVTSSADWGTVGAAITTTSDWGTVGDPITTNSDWGTV